MASMNPLHTSRAYTHTYIEQCFTVWYAAGHPSRNNQIMEILPKDEYGRIPTSKMITSWRDEYGWDIRADELDAKAQALVDDELVNQRVLMLKEQASRARELQKMGIEHLRDEGFDSSSSAVAAVIKGAELERESKGLSTQIVKMFKLDDEKLISETQRLLERLNVPTDVIDVEEVPDEKEDEDEE